MDNKYFKSCTMYLELYENYSGITLRDNTISWCGGGVFTSVLVDSDLSHYMQDIGLMIYY